MKKIFTLGFLALAVTLAGCGEVRPTTANINAKAVEQNQTRLQTVQPAPRLDVSLERANLVERLQRLNTQNMSGYVYLISYGAVVAQYPVKGKVTSLNAYLMAQNAVQEVGRTGKARVYMDVEQPDYDGAYGENAKGVFFFTADTNAYVEWQGEYLFSDSPLAVTIAPKLTREVK